jgi:hypothetical protein
MSRSDIWFASRVCGTQCKSNFVKQNSWYQTWRHVVFGIISLRHIALHDVNGFSWNNSAICSMRSVILGARTSIHLSDPLPSQHSVNAICQLPVAGMSARDTPRWVRSESIVAGVLKESRSISSRTTQVWSVVQMYILDFSRRPCPVGSGGGQRQDIILDVPQGVLSGCARMSSKGRVYWL